MCAPYGLTLGLNQHLLLVAQAELQYRCPAEQTNGYPAATSPAQRESLVPLDDCQTSILSVQALLASTTASDTAGGHKRLLLSISQNISLRATERQFNNRRQTKQASSKNKKKGGKGRR